MGIVSALYLSLDLGIPWGELFKFLITHGGLGRHIKQIFEIVVNINAVCFGCFDY